jgi:hypothetical protein
MNLNLTYAEAQGAIRKLLNLPAEVDVVIGRKPIPSRPIDEFKDVPAYVTRLVQFVDANHTVNKIAAIKELRSFDSYHLGLKEAKDMAENWSIVRPFFLKTHKPPTPVYDPVNYGTILRYQ